MTVPVRHATEADLADVVAIYNEVVGTSEAIWRDDRVTLEDRRAWLAAQHDQSLPVLVALGEPEVIGFASFGPFRPWPGYHPTVEHSIHIDHRHRGRGVGRTLLAALIDEARELDKAVMIAGIDGANRGSIRFHQRAGFREVGRLPGIGRKFGQPVGLVLMQLDLTEPTHGSRAQTGAAAAATTPSPSAADPSVSSGQPGSGRPVAAGTVSAIDHVQLAMPAGGEDRARAFYGNLLALPETPKPANLATRGGCWFESDRVKIHLGVEADFRPARKAHPALRVVDLPALLATLSEAGVRILDDEPLEGYDRAYVDDPFGNRIELLEPR